MLPRYVPNVNGGPPQHKTEVSPLAQCHKTAYVSARVLTRFTLLCFCSRPLPEPLQPPTAGALRAYRLSPSCRGAISSRDPTRGGVRAVSQVSTLGRTSLPHRIHCISRRSPNTFAWENSLTIIVPAQARLFLATMMKSFNYRACVQFRSHINEGHRFVQSMGVAPSRQDVSPVICSAFLRWSFDQYHFSWMAKSCYMCVNGSLFT